MVDGLRKRLDVARGSRFPRFEIELGPISASHGRARIVAVLHPNSLPYQNEFVTLSCYDDMTVIYTHTFKSQLDGPSCGGCLPALERQKCMESSGLRNI